MACLRTQRLYVLFGKMPKRKKVRILEQNKRKNVAIPKSMKNEIREMIKSGLSKSDVEARLQKEKKLEGGINIYQWQRLSASKNQPEEILPTQQYRTIKNPALEDYKAECVQVFREKSKKSALGLDGLLLVCKQVQKLEKYSENGEVQKLLLSRRFSEKLAQNAELVRTYRGSSAENFSEFQVQNYRDGMMLLLAGLDPKSTSYLMDFMSKVRKRYYFRN